MFFEDVINKRIFTIPNLLSVFRLVLIPIFVWTYCVRRAYLVTAGILLLSGLTDIADGFIARRFHMVSALGMALDPIADKLTQAAMLFCLVTRFPLMWFPLIALGMKEISGGILSLLTIRRTGIVMGADWHGKAASMFIFITMFIHLVWFNIPKTISVVTISICAVMLLFSWVLYGWHNIKILIMKG